MGHYIGWLLVRIIMVVAFSALFGYAALVILRHVLAAWQRQDSKKLWFCFSAFALILYLFLRGL